MLSGVCLLLFALIAKNLQVVERLWLLCVRVCVFLLSCVACVCKYTKLACHLLILPLSLSLSLSGALAEQTRETKILRIVKPELEVSSFLAGPAMFGPDIGGEHSFQVCLISHWPH